MTKRVAVLGGGISGAVLARELASRGVRVDLFEREPRLGGLHRSVAVGERVFDIGAFVFGERHALIEGFPRVSAEFPRIAWSAISIRPGGSVDAFPISIRGYAREVGMSGLCTSFLSLAAAKVTSRRRDTVPAYAAYYMGRQIYERSGLAHYIERLYGIPAEEVGMEFAVQRLPDLPRLTLSRTVGRVLRGAAARLAGRTPGSPLARVRPRQGFSHVYAGIGEDLAASGVGIHLGRPVRAVRPAGARFELTLDSGAASYDRVVSTIPIPAALRLLGLTPEATFDTVSLYSMFYAGRLRHPAPMQHNFTLDGRWKRLIAFSRLYGLHEGLDYWTVEVTTRDTSSAALAALRTDFEEHAGRHGVFEGAATFLDATLTAHAYPCFHRGQSEALAAERDRLTAMGIAFVGRQGAFEYVSSDTAARKAAELAAGLTDKDGRLAAPLPRSTAPGSPPPRPAPRSASTAPSRRTPGSR